MQGTRRRKNGASTTTVSVRGQTIIPKPLREACHIREGDLIQWRVVRGGLLAQRVVVRLASQAEFLSDAQWKQLDRLVRRQRQRKQYTQYTSLEEAKKHSRNLAK